MWKPTRRRIRRILRVAIPALMLGFGVIAVYLGGWNGLLALIPILLVHVLVALIVVPLWVRFQRRSKGAKVPEGG